ncbi:MAG: hypothetical protein Q9211_006567, partial [Gyalolechia sp. 1 TL-2023]
RSSTQTLTTFSTPASHPLPVPGNRAGSAVPPGNKGLRGVLDNIVSDGMRVAQEVRKRMDEAQRELERSAAQRPGDEDEEDDEAKEKGEYGGDAERRSVMERDRDLLDGAEAMVEPHGGGGGGKEHEGQLIDVGGEAGEKVEGKIVEFER